MYGRRMVRIMKWGTIFRTLLLVAGVSVAVAQQGTADDFKQSCEAVLRSKMEQFRAESACAVVVSAQDARVLALAECRAEETTLPVMTAETPMALSAHICTLAVAGVLDNGSMRLNTGVDCTPFRWKKSIIRDGRRNFGYLPCAGVMARSSLPGATRLCLYLRKDGVQQLAKKVGFTMPEVEIPLFLDQKIVTTPLQLAAFYTVFARKGVYTPLKTDGSAPEAGTQVLRADTAEKVGEALELCCKMRGKGWMINGTATRAQIPGYRVGCKTGTSSALDAYGKPVDDVMTVSAVGVLPVNAPRVVVAVVMQAPRPEDRAVGGGTVAAPVVRELAQKAIEHLNIEKAE